MLHRPNSSTSQTRPASRLLKDHWYVGCPSSRLTTSAPRAAQIGEFNLVLFRDADGRPRALLDRCSHRGVRLSLGRVTEGRIACGYHGWEFDADGELRHVPSLTAGDKVPVCSVPAFPVVERDFYVWVWIAGQSPAPTYQPQLIGIGERNWIQETAIWDVNVIDAVENALDVAHTPFLHPGIYPGHRSEDGIIPPLHQFTVECCVVDGGVELHIPPRPEGISESRSWEQLSVWARFELPYRNYVFLLRRGTFAILNWTPLADGSCRLDFMGAFDAERDRTGATPTALFREEELKILTQDRTMLESARPCVDEGRDFERSVMSDFPQLLARRLYQAALNGNEFDFDRRRIFQVRG